MDTSEEPMCRVLRSRRAETERPSTSSPPIQLSGSGDDRNSTNERIEGDGSNEQMGPQPRGGPIRKGRGRAKNKALHKIKENSCPVPVEFGEGSIKPVGLNNKLWIAEVGINTRDTEALLKYKTWRDVPDFEKEVCYEYLKRVNKGISNALRKYRYKLTCHFEEHLPIENARRHPYNGIGNAVWQKLCDNWISPKFQEISEKNKENHSKNEVPHYSRSMSFVRRYDAYVKLKERQSQEDEDGERDENPAIRLYKDTHFKEQGGWAHEKAKRNFDAMKEKAAQNSQNSDGTSPTINDVEIVQNQLGIRKGYCRGFGHGFMAPKSQRASSSCDEASRKRVEIAEERNVQMAAKMDKLEKMLEQLQQQPPPWFLQYQQQRQQTAPNWHQQPSPPPVDSHF
ncbi:uncharacterized protein LOC132300805 isoform X2 [Cornus florida]|uniref:uncharacterized protein LOC132300805 isoform X2 n=1 Tax=Cornus florida TaxID=4283 RepID=UPI0028976D9B|nr:uncharacterized protein LOC132300805 isoform X2 [Cornus florida]